MGSTPTLAISFFAKTDGIDQYKESTIPFNLFQMILAPGEARTPDLRISLSLLTYKYDALTDCATGARRSFALLICIEASLAQ